GRRVTQATLLFEVVGGAGVGGEARAEVEHVLDGISCRGGVAELGLRVGEDAVRVGRVGVFAEGTVGQIPRSGELMAGGGAAPRAHTTRPAPRGPRSGGGAR